jgi:tetratricopeptide (TPR) repeat protein
VSDALELSRDNFSLERASRALALCDAHRDAAALVNELERRYPDATLTRKVAVPIVGAVTAIRHGEWTRALDILEAVRPYDHAPWSEFWPAYLRGQAHMGLKQPADAAADFQSIVDHRGEAPLSQLYPLAQLGLARALAAGGETQKARNAYDVFVAQWRDADANVPPLREAMLERQQLR